MVLETLTITRLADLRFGDRIKGWGGRAYNQPRRVMYELGPDRARIARAGRAPRKPGPRQHVGVRAVPLADGRTPFGGRALRELTGKITLFPAMPARSNKGERHELRHPHRQPGRYHELREGDNGPYAYARVLVTDRIRQEDGSYADGATIGYDVSVSGSDAVNLVDAAVASGNIRVTFSGRYRVTEYKGENGTRIQHQVRADEVGVSLRGQKVRVEKATAGTADASANCGDDTPF